MSLRIGIDVGGTNTDAVLMEGTTVRAKLKTPTTADVTSGITTALRHVLTASSIPPSAIAGVMIGTTHFTNAVIERRHLAPTAAIRLGLPAGESLPPMVDWPDDLAAVVGGYVTMAHGGNEFDGRPITPLDAGELKRIAHDVAAHGIPVLALTSIFSPVNPETEERAAAIMREEAPELDITCSHEIGQIGLLERENAAILNACLRPLARRTVDAFQAAIAGFGIAATLYLTQNDGTLMSADFAARYPVLTFASGPSNSVRGAAFLSGLTDALVLDVGGTTCDVGMLVQGFPRRAALTVDVGGVRTNFRMPDVYSFGLGGGSIVTGSAVGPRSVGYRIQQEALVFGGETVTATDVAVAAGRATVGDPARTAALDRDLVRTALARIDEMVANGVDRMKTSAAPQPLIVVGGGSILVDGVPGTSRIVKPNHFEAANAVGAAIAQISGEVDRIFSLDGQTRAHAVARARQEAADRAVTAGAAPHTVEIVDVEDIPLSYLPGNATRIRAKAVGNLRMR